VSGQPLAICRLILRARPWAGASPGSPRVPRANRGCRRHRLVALTRVVHAFRAREVWNDRAGRRSPSPDGAAMATRSRRAMMPPDRMGGLMALSARRPPALMAIAVMTWSCSTPILDGNDDDHDDPEEQPCIRDRRRLETGTADRDANAALRMRHARICSSGCWEDAARRWASGGAAIGSRSARPPVPSPGEAWMRGKPAPESRDMRACRP